MLPSIELEMLSDLRVLSIRQGLWPGRSCYPDMRLAILKPLIKVIISQGMTEMKAGLIAFDPGQSGFPAT